MEQAEHGASSMHNCQCTVEQQTHTHCYLIRVCSRRLATGNHPDCSVQRLTSLTALSGTDSDKWASGASTIPLFLARAVTVWPPAKLGPWNSLEHRGTWWSSQSSQRNQNNGLIRRQWPSLLTVRRVTQNNNSVTNYSYMIIQRYHTALYLKHSCLVLPSFHP